MKRILIMTIISIIAIFGCSNVYALAYGRVTTPKTISRLGPGTNTDADETLYYYDVVPVFSTTKIANKKGCGSGWYKVNINGASRYICSDDLTLSNVTVQTKVKTDVRKGAGTNYAIDQTAPKNKIITLDSTTKYTGAGCSGGWYKVHYGPSNQRYICSSSTTKYRTASNGYVTNKNGAAVRKAPDKSSTSVDTLKYGQGATLFETKRYTGNGCDSGWFRVVYRDQIRYICSADMVVRNNVYKVSDLDGITVRKSPSSSSESKGYLSYNDATILLDTNYYKGSGCPNSWLKISFNGGPGYICSTYVTAYDNTTTLISNSDIKEEASNSSKTIVNLKKYSVVFIRNTTKYKGSGCSDGWYRLSINGKNGYICSSHTELGYVEPTPAQSSTTTQKVASSGKYYTINHWSYRLKENYGNIRSGASTSYGIQDTVYMGTEFEVLSSKAGNSGCSAGWYKVKYYNNKTGYVCKSLVDKYSDITKTDSSYCNTLKKNGFPESYCPFLSYLHSKHSNWVFKPENTGLTFDSAVSGESERNYTQISTSARSYLASTSVREAPNWRTASDAYVAFMLDPRNYLNEQNIFAFEDLSYDSKYHTAAVVKSIFSGTYLADNSYINYFMDAAKTYKVSPIHLASRVKQEGGTNSSYSAVSGKVSTTWNVVKNGYICAANVVVNTSKMTISVKEGIDTQVKKGTATNTASFVYGNGNPVTLNSNDTLTLLSKTKYETTKGCKSGWYKINADKSLKGIYNYYNIGAYGDNPVVRGLAAAAGYVDDNDGTPWNTREKAIKYGAAFIANGYINKGQDTMYYQKFNTGPNSAYAKYTHQYMTNILAPASESLSTYESYSSLKLLNSGYVFKIPVYNSMPSNYTTHPPVK